MNSTAQELPPIQNFSPKIYQAANQNWMISQGANKYIYIANGSGLLENNGSTWNIYDSPRGSEIRSVKVIDDLIYTGFYMDFGFWTRDSYGVLHYNSLIEKLRVPLIEGEDFWKIVEFEGHILFQSLDRIYIYNVVDESFSIIEAKTTRAQIFVVGRSIFFQKIDKGIYTIENGEAILISKDPVILNTTLVGAFTINKETLFLTEKGEFYFLRNANLERWEIEADNELAFRNIYCSTQLSDESLVLGTISNGIIQIDKSGKILAKINKESGLYNNTVLSVFEDKENNLWLGLDNGISILNLRSYFSVYNDLKGKLGVVYTAKQFENNLYIGTNQGLFYKSIKVDSEFKLVSNTQGQVWFLEELYGTLFCGHNNGTYIIDGSESNKISDFPGTWRVKKIESNSQLLLQGNYDGISVLEKSNDQWRFRNVIEGFDVSSRFFEFIGENEILVNHEHKGIFTLRFDKNFSKLNQIKDKSPYGYGSSLVSYDDDIYYSTNLSSKIFKYNLKKKEFLLDSVMTKRFYDKNNKIKGTLVSSIGSSKLWGLSDRNIISVFPGKFNENLEAKNIAISSSFRRSLSIVGFENLTTLEDDRFLIGASDGYAILDLNKLKSKEYYIKINLIQKEFQNASFESIALGESSTFKSNENNLKFLFSVPEFNKYTEVEFQYQLEGIYEEWSTWLSEPSVSFSNLPFGNYTFKVRAKIGNELTKNIETYKFSIEKPWYLTNVVLTGYVLIIILISFIVHKVYKKYYTKQHKRDLKRTQRKLRIENLKNEKALMKSRNDALRQDIESKNRELGLSTMNLIKKNEFLNSLKTEIKNVEGASNLNYIIKIIDKNLNSTDDWKLFEEAFNNADKDFFKKIKIIHPNLSPNDLRLCAYLRLNLSSKEIAPILNISAKSVEVKRYRLRKKMELPHDVSLGNYIFDV